MCLSVDDGPPFPIKGTLQFVPSVRKLEGRYLLLRGWKVAFDAQDCSLEHPLHSAQIREKPNKVISSVLELVTIL